MRIWISLLTLLVVLILSLQSCRKDRKLSHFIGEYDLTIRAYGGQEINSNGAWLNWDSTYLANGRIEYRTPQYDSLDRLKINLPEIYSPYSILTLIVDEIVWISFPVLADGTIPSFTTYQNWGASPSGNIYSHEGYLITDSISVYHYFSNQGYYNRNYSIKGIKK